MAKLESNTGGELNPYRPIVPDEIREVSPALHDYLQEQASTLRIQHNKIQAGDTTFPWEVLTDWSDRQEYTLGSLGGFYHNDYGMILARYVRFTYMNQDIDEGSPIGMDIITDMPWHVTNVLQRSKQELAIGIGACFEKPPSGAFGWVIVSGVNIQSLYADAPVNNEEQVGWIASGLVGLTQHKIGRVRKGSYELVAPNTYDILPGAFFIDALTMPTKATEIPVSPIDIELEIRRLEDLIERGEGSLHVRFDRIEANVRQADAVVTRSISILSERMASVSPDAITAGIRDQIHLAATYRHLAEVAAAQAVGASQASFTTFEAVNESNRTASIYRDEAGIHAESSTTMRNEATLSRNESGVSAAAAAVSEQNAAVSESDAETYSLAALSHSTSAATSAGTAATQASNASTSASQASTSASNAAGSEASASTSATAAATSASGADSSADAAAISESNASTSASGASASATSATTQANNAAVSAGNASTSAISASTSAASATTQAAAAASSALLSANLAQASINENPVFANWSGSHPVSYVSWLGTPTKINPGRFGSPNRMRMVANGAATIGVIQTTSEINSGAYYLIEATVNFVAGGITGAGFYCQWRTSGGAFISSFEIPFISTRTNNGLIASTLAEHSYSKLIQAPATAAALEVFIVGDWPGGGVLGGSSAKTIDWIRFVIRPADVTVLTQALASIDSNGNAIAAWETTTIAGAASAAIRMRSQTGPGVYDSTIAMEAEEFQVWNGTTRSLAMRVTGARAQFMGDLDVGGAIRIGDRRIAVALQSFKLQASDGDTVSFGADLINTPLLLFETNGLVPKTAAQAYDVKALSLTSTGFTMRAKILTPGATASVSQGPGSNVGGTPVFTMQKGDAADAYDANYEFTVTMSVSCDDFNGLSWEGYGECDCYVRPSGGAWTSIGTIPFFGVRATQGVSTFQQAQSFVYSGVIGQHGSDTEFGAHPALGSISSFDTVTYTKQATSGESSATPSGEKVLVTVIPQNI